MDTTTQNNVIILLMIEENLTQNRISNNNQV